MTSSLAKVNKSLGAHFRALFLKFPNFLMFLNIQIDLLILKTYNGQFTLTTEKNHCISSLRSLNGCKPFQVGFTQHLTGLQLTYHVLTLLRYSRSLIFYFVCRCQCGWKDSTL